MLKPVNDQNLDQSLAEAKLPVILYFWAPWSRTCKTLDPAIDEIADNFKGKLICYRLNVDECAHAPAQYGVKFLPHLSLLRGGRIIDSIEGRLPLSKFREFIQKNM